MQVNARIITVGSERWAKAIDANGKVTFTLDKVSAKRLARSIRLRSKSAWMHSGRQNERETK
jgi:hypothetical protein